MSHTSRESHGSHGSHARRSLVTALVVLAGAAVALESLTAAGAGAQQLAPSRFDGKAAVATPAVGGSDATTGITAAVARDSVAHYLSAAYTERRNGGAFAVAGLAAITVAYAQFARSGSMGMNGAQSAALVGGTALGAFGSAQLVRSRESFAIADWWRQRLVTARR